MVKTLYEYYLKNIPHRGKRHIVRWSLGVLPFRSLRSFYGPAISVVRGDKTCVYALCGEYGRVVADHVESIGEGEIFIDIGANYGLFSLLAAERVGESGHVFSFEPNR